MYKTESIRFLIFKRIPNPELFEESFINDCELPIFINIYDLLLWNLGLKNREIEPYDLIHSQ